MNKYIVFRVNGKIAMQRADEMDASSHEQLKVSPELEYIGVVDMDEVIASSSLHKELEAARYHV